MHLDLIVDNYFKRIPFKKILITNPKHAKRILTFDFWVTLP